MTAISNIEQAVNDIKVYLLALQDQITNSAEVEDGQAKFLEDPWEYPEGGGGRSRVLKDGTVFEKAGVNFSHIQGAQLPPAATAKRPDLANAHFQALGVSCVMHPLNPHVPTSHFNVRAIIVKKSDGTDCWWFGGGFDLTPYFGYKEDCIHWHRMTKAACEPFGEHVYPEYKKWADDYFYLKHRNEPRGIGGIFFDDVNHWSFECCFAFMQSVGEHYLKAYLPIVARRKHQAYQQAERDFQLYRRGRYVEFNLIYDRGTLFGLQSKGRTESILMSLPPLVAWEYNRHPKVDSAEEKLYQEFLVPKDWLNL